MNHLEKKSMKSQIGGTFRLKGRREMNSKYHAKLKLDHDGLYLSVTHNGYQWNNINIKEPKIEIPKLIKALSSYEKEPHCTCKWGNDCPVPDNECPILNGGL